MSSDRPCPECFDDFAYASSSLLPGETLDWECSCEQLNCDSSENCSCPYCVD